MKKILISLAVIVALLGAAGGLMYLFGQTPPSIRTDTPGPEPAVAETTPTPLPISVPETTPVPTPSPSPTPFSQTELNNSAAVEEKTEQYNGWPAIPESQLPQPDHPINAYDYNGTTVIIPTSGNQSQSGDFLGIQSNNTGIVIPSGHSSTDPSSLDWLAEEIFLLTNQERVNAGLNKLGYAYDLQTAADTRAREASIQFSHTRPNGTSCHSVVENFDYYVTGENLIMADKPVATAENMVASWMNSEGHRYNILLPEFTKMAVGIYESNGVVYATQIFLG